MDNWKGIEKEIANRQYKLNPFDKKYVNLTTSSIHNQTNVDGDEALDRFSKEIRVRTDIIGCQISYLIKEATAASSGRNNLADVKSQEGKPKSLEIIDSSEDGCEGFFASIDLVDHDKLALLNHLEGASNTPIPDHLVHVNMRYTEELMKQLSVDAKCNIFQYFRSSLHANELIVTESKLSNHYSTPFFDSVDSLVVDMSVD